MIFPTVTALYAGLLALLFAGLSGWVVVSRGASGMMQGGDETLMKRVRAQENFAEYVPFALLLIGLLEASGAAAGFVQLLLLVLLVARVLHPFGLFAKPNTMPMFVCRGGGIAGTLLVLSVAAVALIIRAV